MCLPSISPGGECWFITDADSRKGRLPKLGALIGVCAQSERAPYPYVSIQGPVVAMEPALIDEHLRPMARRYLGLVEGDLYD